MSKNLNETIAHAIHSLTLNELRKFNPDAEIDNGVPVVNPRLNDPTTNVRVVPNAPEEAIGELIYPRKGVRKWASFLFASRCERVVGIRGALCKSVIRS